MKDWRDAERGLTDEEAFLARLKKTVAVVEATHTEQHFLWMQYSTQSDWDDMKRPSARKMKWEQANPGRMVMLGEIDGREVWMSIFFNVIEGQFVLFWELTSTACDYALADKWFEENLKPYPTYDRGGRRASVDAMNFHNAVDAIRQAAGLE